MVSALLAGLVNLANTIPAMHAWNMNRELIFNKLIKRKSTVLFILQVNTSPGTGAEDRIVV